MGNPLESIFRNSFDYQIMDHEVKKRHEALRENIRLGISAVVIILALAQSMIH